MVHFMVHFVLVLSVQLSMHHDHAHRWSGDLSHGWWVGAPNELMNLWSDEASLGSVVRPCDFIENHQRV